MKKHAITLIFTFLSCFIYAQGEYRNGFENGYKSGYCYNDFGCISPIPPVAPIPNVGESSLSYQDGYNRGFKAGLEDKNKTGNSSQNNSKYQAQTQPYVSQYVGPKNNIDLFLQAGAIIEARYDNNKIYRDNLIDWVFELKTKTDEKAFLDEMDKNYYQLRAMDGQNFAQLGDQIDKIKFRIKEAIDAYNNRIRTNSYSSQTTLEKESSAALSYYDKAIENWKNNNKQSALENINKSIELDQNNPDAYYFRGYVYLYGIRNFNQALNDFSQVIQMQPENYFAYFYRGMTYDELNKKIEAIKDFTKTITLKEDNTDAYFMRGLLKSNLGDRNGAINDYDEILKRELTTKPTIYKMATVYNNKAYCYVEQGKLNEALPLVNKALQLDEGEWYIWDTRAEIYYKMGNYEKCIIDMTKAISIEQHDNSFYYRGLSKIKLNKIDDGCLDLSKAGELGKSEAYEAISKNCK